MTVAPDHRFGACQHPAPHKHLSLAQWTEAISHSFHNLTITADDPQAFRAGRRQALLGEILLVDMATDAHRVCQPHVVPENTQPAMCKLSLQIEGQSQLTQDCRTTVLAPGDLALYVTHRPYELVFDRPQRSLVMQFPQEYLHLVQEQVSLVTATPVSREHGLGRVVVPLFENLVNNLQILHTPSALSLVRSSLQMLVTILLEASKAQGRDTSENPLFHLATAYIEDHLGDAELGPQRIAEHFYVSVRQLYARFAEHGTTVSTMIRDLRLHRIRDDLADPVHASETVQQISTRYGIHDASQVSKLFKQAFGESPSAYRARVKNPGA
ncbi:AraC-like ligand-binding domain-containing protein [Auritidibacter ignavus]|uniref:AraC-like ligand-binding domain-containing protein n=1 Tax=Auritidibacter ignavus TaxID=678932 RepID=UPI0021054B3F|nr:helix-turn-helix domain-containing protein [Auritidibacter ignavus]